MRDKDRYIDGIECSWRLADSTPALRIDEHGEDRDTWCAAYHNDVRALLDERGQLRKALEAIVDYVEGGRESSDDISHAEVTIYNTARQTLNAR